MPKLTKLAAVMEEMKDNLITMEDLSAKSKLSVRTIWTAKNGQTVSVKTARAICKAVGKRIEELR